MEITYLHRKKKKKNNKLTTADIKRKTGELCNFLCSVKYWCFLLLLSLLSIDVPDIWFRWRQCKSPTPKENGGKVIKWTFDAQQNRGLVSSEWRGWKWTGILQEGQVLQAVLDSLAKGTGWNSQPEMPAAQHLHEAGLLQPSLRWGSFREGCEPQLSCTQAWMFSVT